jgi:predicted peroxiredoxin
MGYEKIMFALMNGQTVLTKIWHNKGIIRLYNAIYTPKLMEGDLSP